MKEINKWQINRGKVCSTPGCWAKARVKGLCLTCYENKKRKEVKNR